MHLGAGQVPKAPRGRGRVSIKVTPWQTMAVGSANDVPQRRYGDRALTGPGAHHGKH